MTLIYEGHTAIEAHADLDALWGQVATGDSAEAVARAAADTAEATARIAADVPMFRQWGQNPATTAGLTFGWFGGQAWTAAGTLTSVANGTTGLPNNTTNYVERTLFGVVSANAVGFTAGRLPMAIVVTAGGAITSVSDAREFSLGYTPAVTGEVAPVDFRYTVGDPRRYGATGTGIDDDRAALVNADLSCVALGIAMPFSRGTYFVATSLTIASRVVMPLGAKLKPALGATVTLSATAPVNAGVYQVFDLSLLGLVRFTSGNPVQAEVEWFGATGNPAAQAAIDALPSAVGGEVRVNTIFGLNSPLRVAQRNHIALVGRRNANNGFQQARFTGTVKGPLCMIGSTTCSELVGSLVGGPGQALTLDGRLNQFVDLQDANTCELNGRAAVTIELFHKYLATPTGSSAYFMASYGKFYNGEVAEVDQSFYFRVSTADALEAALNVSGTLYTLASANGVMLPNVTQHLALTFDGATIRLFVAGVLVASTAAAGTITQTPKERFLTAGPQNTRNGGQLVNFMTCTYDSIRVSSTARYLAGFVAPTAKHTTDANTLILVNFDSVVDGLITCQTGAAGVAYLIYRNAGPFLQNIRVQDLQFQNTAGGMGLFVTDCPYGLYTDISATGRIAMYFRRNLFVCNFNNLKASTDLVNGRIGILFESGTAGSFWRGGDVEGFPYGVIDSGGLSTMKDVFMNTQPDTICPIVSISGANLVIDGLAMDDEAAAAAGVVRKAAILIADAPTFQLSNSRVSWAGSMAPIWLKIAQPRYMATFQSTEFGVPHAALAEVIHMSSASDITKAKHPISMIGCSQEQRAVAIPWTLNPEYLNYVADDAGFQIGAGTPLGLVKVYAPNLTPASVPAASVSRQTFAVAGVTTADKIIVNPPAAAGSVACVAGRASAVDTVELTFSNPTAGALTPTAGVHSLIAIRS